MQMTDELSRVVADSRQLHPNWNDDDHLLNILVDNAKRFPDHVAMRERDRGVWQEYTWSRYLDDVLCFAAGLETRGVKPEDVVLVIGDNRPALYLSMLGAITLRAIPSPAYPDTRPEELAGQIQRENIRFAVAEDQEQVDKLMHVCERSEERRVGKECREGWSPSRVK